MWSAALKQHQHYHLEPRDSLQKIPFPLWTADKRLWRVVVTDCWWSYDILQLARLLLANGIIYIATDHIMVNEHLLLLRQLDWLLCPPSNSFCFVLQVNVFVPAVLKSEDVKHTELKVKTVVMCMGASFSFCKNCFLCACIVIKDVLYSIANTILFSQTHIPRMLLQDSRVFGCQTPISHHKLRSDYLKQRKLDEKYH